MTWLLAGPIVLPLVSAVITRMLPRGSIAQRLFSLASALALLGVSMTLLIHVWRNGILAGQMGDWPAPFGITLVADHLAASMVAVTAVIGVATVVYSFADNPVRGLSDGFHTLLHVLLAGVCGAFLAGDIFNLYVWYEVMLIFVVRLAGARWNPGAVRRGGAVCSAQPRRDDFPSQRYRPPLRTHGHTQHGRLAFACARG